MRAAIAIFLLLTGCSAQVDTKDDAEDPTVPAEACQAPGYYDPVTPAERWESVDFDGWPVVEWMNDDPAGLVFYFHGTGGQGSDIMFLEPTREMDTLVRAGFSFVSTSSDDRSEQAQWNTTDDSWTGNPDLARLAAIRDDLIAQGDITEDTPIFTSGFSDGGAMSGFFSATAKKKGWPVKAAVIHDSAGQATPDIPQIWLIAANEDQNIGLNAPDAYQAQTDAGALTEWHLAVEEPLDPMRFLRIPRFTEDDSQQAFDDLVGLGMVDADGTRLIDLDTQLDSSLSGFERSSNVQQDWEVSGEMRVVWSTHRVDSQWAQNVCEFLVDQL